MNWRNRMFVNKKLRKLYSSKPVFAGIIVAVVINVLFYATEWILWKYTNVCVGVTWHYYDFVIRMVMGFLGLLALFSFYEDDLKSVFCGQISMRAWMFCIPLGVSLLLSVCELFAAGNLTGANTGAFFIAWLTQIGSGFFEEIVGRGVLMSGFISKYKRTVKGRLFIVGMTGLIFGLLHFMNFIFGNSLFYCAFWGLSTMLWGMLLAALYLISSNLWLVIGIHIVWDIVCKIPSYFIAEIKNETLLDMLIFAEDYIMNGVFLMCAVAICVWGSKELERCETGTDVELKGH